jgi:peptidoglycan/LPS O-acetylase OafA/YrhL
MFLLHWAVSVVLSVWLFQGQASFDAPTLLQGARYFATMFAGVLVASLAFHLLVDRPIERWRKAIRGRVVAWPSLALRRGAGLPP